MNNINLFNTVIEHTVRNIGQAQIDAAFNSTYKVEPTKSISTGALRAHYRFAEDFVVVESVLHGFKKKFLDGVKVFTKDGSFIGEVFRIRNNEYDVDASRETVGKIISKYLHTLYNKEKYLNKNINQLYCAGTQAFCTDAVKSVQRLDKVVTESAKTTQD